MTTTDTTTPAISRSTMRTLTSTIAGARDHSAKALMRAGWASWSTPTSGTLVDVLTALRPEHDRNAPEVVRAIVTKISTLTGPGLRPAPADAVIILELFAAILEDAAADNCPAAAGRLIRIWRQAEHWIARDGNFCWVQGSAIRSGRLIKLAADVLQSHHLGTPSPGQLYEARAGKLARVKWSSTVEDGGRARVRAHVDGLAITAAYTRPAED